MPDLPHLRKPQLPEGRLNGLFLQRGIPIGCPVGGCGMMVSKGERYVKITLWTIQHADAWVVLERDGVLRADSRRGWTEFRFAYDWMAEQMGKRIGPPPDGVPVPLWAWYQWEGRRGPRDLRQSGYAPRGTPMVQIEFEIEESQELLSDFDRWNTVLGGC